MYNKLLQLNYFPTEWKRGELVYFLKKGKAPDDENSYRPISLLPTMGKVLEKLLLKRFLYSLNNNEGLVSSQHGFVPGKSTETAIMEVFDHIEESQHQDNYTFLISLDFSHAFDCLPWNPTIEELETLNLEKPYINTTASFLSLRSAFLNWLYEDEHWFTKGCPQGSCFGPFLWRIFLNTLLKLLKEKRYLAVAYADDVLLMIKGKTRNEVEKTGNEAIKLVSNWAEKYNINISQEKTKILQIRRPKYLKRQPIIKLNNKSIKAETTIQYLGITIDETLSFLPHLHQKRIEISEITQNLFKFAATNGGISKSILKLWYSQILEKKITYAAPTWYPKLQKAHGLRELSAIQAQCLLLVSRAYKKTATIALCTLTEILPLHLKMEKIATQGAVLRLHRTSNTYKPEDYQQKYIPTDIPPFIEYYKWSDEHTPQIPEPQLEIYTDGSKMEEGVGYAFCVFQDGNELFKLQKRLRPCDSVFQAEQLAILDALKWSEKITHITSESIQIACLVYKP